jgi:hypothetical protein
MRRNLIIFLAFLSIVFCTNGYAQNAVNPSSDTVRWNYGRGENKARAEALAISGHLISYGGRGFLWVQNGTDRKYSFQVKSAKGTWQDGEQNGEIVYDATCDGIDGTIRIYRKNREVGIQINFALPDKLTPNVLLEINSYNRM